MIDFDPATELSRDTKPLGLRIEKYVPPAAVLPQLDRVPALGALEAREANLAAKLLAAKEPLEGFIQAVGKGLNGRLRDVFAAPRPLKRYVRS